MSVQLYRPASRIILAQASVVLVTLEPACGTAASARPGREPHWDDSRHSALIPGEHP